MPFGPNAPQVGFVDGLNLFDVGIALAHKFWGWVGIHTAERTFRFFSWPKYAVSEPTGKKGAIWSTSLLWTSPVWLRTTARDLSRRRSSRSPRSRAAKMAAAMLRALWLRLLTAGTPPRPSLEEGKRSARIQDSADQIRIRSRKILRKLSELVTHDNRLPFWIEE
jgi:hypothetical protein